MLKRSGERETGSSILRQTRLKGAVDDHADDRRPQCRTKLTEVANHASSHPQVCLWEGILSRYHLNGKEGACTKTKESPIMTRQVCSVMRVIRKLLIVISVMPMMIVV
jgi:hypothetical protein